MSTCVYFLKSSIYLVPSSYNICDQIQYIPLWYCHEYPNFLKSEIRRLTKAEFFKTLGFFSKWKLNKWIAKTWYRYKMIGFFSISTDSKHCFWKCRGEQPWKLLKIRTIRKEINNNKNLRENKKPIGHIAHPSNNSHNVISFKESY